MAAAERSASVAVTIDLAEISDEASFHRVFQRVMGFPALYGANQNAWIDCMSCIEAPESGLTTVTVPLGGTLVIGLKSFTDFRQRLPEICEMLIELVAIVNERLGEGAIVLRPDAA